VPSGGRRPGAGRKPGGRNERTREIADRLNLEGLSPLEVMVEAMRRHVTANDWDAAAAIAKDAAPYMHPRLATVNVGNKDDEPFRVEHANARHLLLEKLGRLAARKGDGEMTGGLH
jgi:hypothetical protein